jgi:exopolyphosphatase/guanosine-5'-triphosphate,3'-diphosphate pyrophosphatase
MVVQDILDLLSKYKAHTKHALQVQKLSLLIFDQMKEMELHNMSEKKRKMLDIASLLHDIGYFIGSKGHNKNSAELIQKEDFEDMDDENKLMIGAIARYHRGSLPSKHHAVYSSFSDKKKRTLQKLAGILRLCDGLDRSHLGMIADLKLEYDAKNNILWCRVIPQNPDLTVDLSSARRKKELFEKGFETQMVIVFS